MTSRVALASLGLLLVSACQVAFGDFTIDTTRLAVSCEVGRARCLGSQIQTCVGGNEWRVLDTCASPDLCNLLSLSCTPCEPGTFQCSGPQPQKCDGDRHWQPDGDACDSASLCELPADGTRAMCRTASCPAPEPLVKGQPAVPQMYCSNDGHLQRCPLSRTGWQDVEICASPALCNLAQANLQVAAGKPATCLLPACSPGQYNCDTGSPRPCKADRTGWDAEAMRCAGATCNPDKGDCSSCIPGTVTCSGPNLQQCTAQATWTSTTCSSALSCNAGANPGCGDPTTCTPGEFRCQAAGLERCRSDGTTWEKTLQCLNGALCNPNAVSCEVPVCQTVGALRCQGNTQQRCRENLTGWVEVTQCVAPSSCDPTSGCLPTPCTTGGFRCNDVTLETCTDGTWVRKDTCETPALCDAAKHTCTKPTCDVGERQCQGNVILLCKPERNAWKEFETCTDGAVCSPDTKHCEQR